MRVAATGLAAGLICFFLFIATVRVGWRMLGQPDFGFEGASMAEWMGILFGMGMGTYVAVQEA